MADARKLLQGFLSKHEAEFVQADLPALESKAGRREDVTDAYLADLAERKHLKLATLDHDMSHSAVEVIA